MSVYVRVSAPGRPSFLCVTRHPASCLPQPLFKKFTQTRWATPVETLEEIIAAVGVRLPEFSELKDCFREVRKSSGMDLGIGAVWTPTLTSSVYTPPTHTHLCLHMHMGNAGPRVCLGSFSPLGRCQWMAHLPWLLPAQELMEAVHLHLVKEYIIRLSKRRLVLKTEEQQQQLARHILANADVIQHFCTQNVSTSHPHPDTPDWPCSLPKPGQLLLS